MNIPYYSLALDFLIRPIIDKELREYRDRVKARMRDLPEEIESYIIRIMYET